MSLSPRPVEGEDEERRKGIVRRFMVTCKVAEYVISPGSPWWRSCGIEEKKSERS